MRALVRRYEDGDAEHLQWAELKQILLSLPARDDAEPLTTPAVVAKAKRTAAKTGKLLNPAAATVALYNALLLTLVVASLQAQLVLTQPRSRKSHLPVLTQPRSRKSRLPVPTQPGSRESHLPVLT